jgi:hypothetical protein
LRWNSGCEQLENVEFCHTQVRISLPRTLAFSLTANTRMYTLNCKISHGRIPALFPNRLSTAAYQQCLKTYVERVLSLNLNLKLEIPAWSVPDLSPPPDGFTDKLDDFQPWDQLQWWPGPLHAKIWSSHHSKTQYVNHFSFNLSIQFYHDAVWLGTNLEGKTLVLGVKKNRKYYSKQGR